MSITERTLRIWRKEALSMKEGLAGPFSNLLNAEEWDRYTKDDFKMSLVEKENRILRMTQELLDAHLIRKK